MIYEYVVASSPAEHPGDDVLDGGETGGSHHGRVDLPKGAPQVRSSFTKLNITERLWIFPKGT